MLDELIELVIEILDNKYGKFVALIGITLMILALSLIL